MAADEAADTSGRRADAALGGADVGDRAAGRAGVEDGRTWAGSAVTGAATTAGSTPSSAAASPSAGSTAPRSTAAARCAGVGIPAGDAVDAGPPRREPDRGADRPVPTIPTDDVTIVLPSSEASALISCAKSANSAAGICCGPSQTPPPGAGAPRR